MMAEASKVTAFKGDVILASGALEDVVPRVKAVLHAAPEASVLVFDDVTGQVVDLDLRGGAADVIARPNSQPQRRGRPKLGVVAREVTLLPRHWDWLAAQPGGASNALRRLTESAMRATLLEGTLRARREAAYRFMTAMAGNLPGFEEAIRALFADNRVRFEECIRNWPADVQAYAQRLAWDEPLLTGSGTST